MSTEDMRNQRGQLLLELDDQKTLVSSLKERDVRDKAVLSEFARLYNLGGADIELRNEGVVCGTWNASLASLEIVSLLTRRAEFTEAVIKLGELQNRAKQLGSTLA